jgi:uncharacterized GH25 family protein
MNSRKLFALAAALGFSVSAAHAHRAWILPSVTVFSGEEQWVSVEAAVSNNLFFPNHRPVALAQIEVRAPDGSPVELQNATSGQIRSSFELQLKQQGTYVISLRPGSGRRPAMGGPGGKQSADGKQQPQGNLMGSYTENGKPQRWRGSPETLVSEGVASKPDFKLTESGGRSVVSFVTLGKPSTETLKPTGKGFEVEYVTHPNDLFTGEPATFRFLMDGQPAANVEVALVRGDDRYRDESGEVTLHTDANGNVKIDFEETGRYWMEATYAQPGTLHGVPSVKNFTYVATFEVLPN